MGKWLEFLLHLISILNNELYHILKIVLKKNIDSLRLIFKGVFKFYITFITVSYTHLDVYKRQVSDLQLMHTGIIIAEENGLLQRYIKLT